MTVTRHMNEWAKQGLRALEHHLISLPQNSSSSARCQPPQPCLGSLTQKSASTGATRLPFLRCCSGPGPGWSTGWEDSLRLQAVITGRGRTHQNGTGAVIETGCNSGLHRTNFRCVTWLPLLLSTSQYSQLPCVLIGCLACRLSSSLSTLSTTPPHRLAQCLALVGTQRTQ